MMRTRETKVEAKHKDNVVTNGTCIKTIVTSWPAIVTVSLLVLYNVMTDSTNSYVYHHAAVASDAVPCSRIGTQILKKGGSAIDAAVASSFCASTVYVHCTGIGGGGFLLYYSANHKKSIVVDFRETAPSNITEEMMQKYIEDDTSTIQGLHQW